MTAFFDGFPAPSFRRRRPRGPALLLLFLLFLVLSGAAAFAPSFPRPLPSRTPGLSPCRRLTSLRATPPPKDEDEGFLGGKTRAALVRLRQLLLSEEDAEEAPPSFGRSLRDFLFAPPPTASEGGWFDDRLAAFVDTLGEFVRKIRTSLPALRLSLLSFSAGLVLAAAAIFGPIYAEISASSSASDTAPRNSLLEPMTLFENILSDLDARYVDAVDTRRLFETGVGAMLRSLDPYTEFENRKDAVAMNEMVTGKYAGVGLVIAERPVNEGKLDLKEETLKSLAVDAEDERSPFDAQKDDGFELDLDAAKSYLEAEDDDAVKPKTVAKTADKKKVQTEIRVVTAFEGYAFDAGMRPGDKLVAVDGTTIKGSTAEQVRLMLRGEPGTEVSVDFERDGVQGISNVQIPRRLVKIPDIKLTTFLGEKKEGIGYVQLSAFSGDTGAEMRQSILALQKAAERADPSAQGLRGLVVDLRGNPGGLLTSAVDVCSLLLPNGSDIVSARGRGFPGVLYRSRTEPLLDPATKLVVLVNGSTASAAEIVSGAVQDLDVGVILGAERTFGKGLVQNVENLPFDTALKFTVAKYYTPSGRCIQSTNYAEGGGSDAKDGKFVATKVEEKDKTEYFTRAGRRVQDGGGIEADVKVPTPKASALEVTLLRSDMFNRYAGEWTKTHKLRDNFAVNDETYRDFQNFVTQTQRDGRVRLESLYLGPLEVLKKELQQSGYTTSKKELEALQNNIVREMERDFVAYKKDIKEDLSTAILSRYLPSSMLLDRSLRTDVQVTAAYKLISNPSKFNKILARNSDGTPGRERGDLAMERARRKRDVARNVEEVRMGKMRGVNVGENFDGLPRLNINF